MANEITAGSLVYVNRSKLGSDGFYGVFTVVGFSGDDLALCRGEYDVTPERGEYDVFMNRSRCELTD